METANLINLPQRQGFEHGPSSPSQLENATVPLRLCARLSGWEWGGQVGKADTFSDGL
ncbi:MAG: hypothetical protein ACOX52_08170 [Verrucomicrobiota bacterium]